MEFIWQLVQLQSVTKTGNIKNHKIYKFIREKKKILSLTIKREIINLIVISFKLQHHMRFRKNISVNTKVIEAV